MCDPKTKIIESKNLICLILCMALILNSGCQRNQQKPTSLPKENTTESASQNVVQENHSNDSDSSNPSIQPKSAATGEGFWQDVTETANSFAIIPLTGAVVAIIGLEYEFWRTLAEAF